MDLSIAFRAGLVPPQCLRAVSVRGREAINSLYEFEAVVVSTLAPPLFEKLVLGRRASFAVKARGARRATHGIVSAMRVDRVRTPETDGPELTQYTLRLVPRAWLLGQRFGSRIFQGDSIDQVIHKVATALEVPVRFRLEKELPRRAYCTQFGETELEFVSRLAAENGLQFYFVQPSPALDAELDGALDTIGSIAELLPLPDVVSDVLAAQTGEVMMFTDLASYPPIRSLGFAVQDELAAQGVPLSFERTFGPVTLAARVPSPALRVHQTGGAAHEEDSILDATRTLSVTPTVASFVEYDPRRPRQSIQSRRRALKERPELALDVGNIANLLSDPTPLADRAMEGVFEHRNLEIYRHHGRDLFPSVERSREEASRMLEQERRDRDAVNGSSDSVRLEAGHTFEIEGHAVGDVNGSYVVVEAELSVSDSTYAASRAGEIVCRFVAVPHEVKYVPKHPPPRFVQTMVVGRVVGPEGDDIHVNEHGEIKVAFPWDGTVGEDGRSPQEASCWLRTMQTWAGPGWGTQFIPRVGMEVIVTFDGGDPDKPIVLGAVYNGITPPPYRLPQERTISGIRTRSSPSGGGYNELAFEDAVGREFVRLRAERDLQTIVQHDRTSDVSGQEVTHVAKDQTLSVGGDRRVLVKGELRTEVHRDETLHVGGSRQVDVRGATRETVDGSRTTLVQGREEITVRGDTLDERQGDVTTRIHGSFAALVGQNNDPRGANLQVHGPLSVRATGGIDIASEKEIVLRVGSAFIRIGDGQIEVGAGDVTVAGEDAKLELAEGIAKFKVKDAFNVKSDDKVVLVSSGASLGLTSEAKLDGSQVLLNSPSSATVSIDISEPEPTKIELVDADGNPIGYERYRIVFDDGTIESGVLNGEGKAEVLIEETAKIEFPDLGGVEED